MTRPPEILGVHGVVIETPDLARAAERWSAALGLSVLRRTRREIVLGDGPDLFVALRRARGEERVAEIHVAVAALTGRATPDALGGDSRSLPVPGVRLTLRQFRRPPSRSWRRRRGR